MNVEAHKNWPNVRDNAYFNWNLLSSVQNVRSISGQAREPPAVDPVDH